MGEVEEGVSGGWWGGGECMVKMEWKWREGKMGG